jgi:transposase-like protein
MSSCQHNEVKRIRALYVRGRPVYKCLHCGAHVIDENTNPSYKGTIRLRKR